MWLLDECQYIQWGKGSFKLKGRRLTKRLKIDSRDINLMWDVDNYSVWTKVCFTDWLFDLFTTVWIPNHFPKNKPDKIFPCLCEILNNILLQINLSLMLFRQCNSLNSPPIFFGSLFVSCYINTRLVHWEITKPLQCTNTE